MVDPAYAGALIDGRGDDYSGCILLGVRLRKFCLWHRLLLRVVQSPLVTGKPITMFDIRVAVGICSTQFGDSKIRKPRLYPTLLFLRSLALTFLWPWRVKGPDGKERWHQRSLRKLALAFVEYTGDYKQEPEFAVIPPKSGSSSPELRGKAPPELEQAWLIAKHTGWSEEYVWNMPLGRSNWYRVLALKADGADIDFVDDNERKFRETVPPQFRHPKKA
jgi:hypothetical protein